MELPTLTIRGPPIAMDAAQRLPPSLTALDAVLATLLHGIEPVAAVELPLREARDCVVADIAPLRACPQHDVALADGWAFRARDLVGASSYSPLPLTTEARWVEAGDPMPSGCDCVIDEESIDQSGPIAQAVTEAPPGHGVRRRGDDVPDGFALAPGTPLRPLDILLVRTTGLEKIRVRRPQLCLVNIPATSGEAKTARLIEESARFAGADVTFAEAGSRDAASIANALDAASCDLLVTVGGSGVGRSDATVLAIGQRGEVLAHGLALRPGATSAVGRIGKTPVVALPGSADGALATWWTLVLPALDRLSGRQPRKTTILPLARKLASGVGIAEIALLERNDDSWVPLALGDLPLQAILRADAWLAVPGNSEGYAAGTPIGAYMLR